jgi:hypothetical protein
VLRAAVQCSVTLLGCSASMSSRLASMKTPGECKALLDSEIREGLEDIAAVEIGDEPGRRAA